MEFVKLTLLVLLFCGSAQAQTFAEWFSQKKTQKKYLLQQISALQMYSGYLSKGYQIAKGGLGSIGNYVGDEFGMHGNYYQHLKTVNGPVKNNPQVNQILRWQQEIITETRRLKNQIGLTTAEHNYISKVCQSLLADCDAQLHDLETVLIDQKIEMGDEERLRHIARLHGSMQDNYRFVASFRTQVRLYIRNKANEQRDVNHLSKLYENH